MSDVERWQAIWDGAEETLRRLLAGDVSDDAELAPVVELPAPDEAEDEPEGAS